MVAIPSQPRADAPFAHHVLRRTVVLPELRVLFLPTPKAGCTSVLWRLAALAGIPPETFAQSTLPEPSSALTVHDMSLWPPENRLADHAPAERERLLAAPGWLRFSIVRDPADRLWSAWQSKLLLREPRFVDEFGDAPWFPRIPERPSDLVEDFRAFVAAVGRGAAEDVHWAVQHALVTQLPLDHVGRVERHGDTLALLAEHVGDAAGPTVDRRENTAPLRLPAGVYDRSSADVVRDVYHADLAAYGYAEPEPAALDPGFERRTAEQLPLVRAIIDERTRVRQLHDVARRRGRRLSAAEERLESAGAANGGPTRSPTLTNLEGQIDFNVRWAWADGGLEPGFTAVVRVKDEARSLPWTLPPLLRAARRVLVIDNASTDGTAGVARELAAAHGASDRLELRSYPFAVARCGSEHLATPVASVHSLAYFYNWSFAQVRTRYALKWDGDMVLTDAAVAALRDLAWQLEGAEVVVRVPRHPLYVASDRRAFLDRGLRNCEAWAWPNRAGYSFVKAMEWELPMFPAGVRTISLPDFGCVELKHLDADEFGHWSATEFDASARTARKRRELETFRALAGGGAPPPGVLEVRSPAGLHVIEHVRSAWLPRLAAGT